MIDKLKTTTVIVMLPANIAVADDYQAKKNDEIEVFAAVLRSEVSANNWTDGELIFFSIRGKACVERTSSVCSIEVDICGAAIKSNSGGDSACLREDVRPETGGMNYSM